MNRFFFLNGILLSFMCRYYVFSFHFMKSHLSPPSPAQSSTSSPPALHFDLCAIDFYCAFAGCNRDCAYLNRFFLYFTIIVPIYNKYSAGIRHMEKPFLSASPRLRGATIAASTNRLITVRNCSVIYDPETAERAPNGGGERIQKTLGLHVGSQNDRTWMYIRKPSFSGCQPAESGTIGAWEGREIPSFSGSQNCRAWQNGNWRATGEGSGKREIPPLVVEKCKDFPFPKTQLIY